MICAQAELRRLTGGLRACRPGRTKADTWQKCRPSCLLEESVSALSTVSLTLGATRVGSWCELYHPGWARGADGAGIDGVRHGFREVVSTVRNNPFLFTCPLSRPSSASNPRTFGPSCRVPRLPAPPLVSGFPCALARFGGGAVLAAFFGDQSKGSSLGRQKRKPRHAEHRHPRRQHRRHP